MRFEINGEKHYFAKPTTVYQCLLAEDQKKDRNSCTGKGWGPFYLATPDENDRIKLEYYRLPKYKGPGFKNDPSISQEQRDAWCIEARKNYTKELFVPVRKEIDDLLKEGWKPAQVNEELGKRHRLSKSQILAGSGQTEQDPRQRELLEKKRQQKQEAKDLKRQARMDKKKRRLGAMDESQDGQNGAKKIKSLPVIELHLLQYLPPEIMGQMLTIASNMIAGVVTNVDLWRSIRMGTALECFSILVNHADLRQAILSQQFIPPNHYDVALALGSIVMTSDAMLDEPKMPAPQQLFMSLQQCVQCICRQLPPPPSLPVAHMPLMQLA